MTIVRHYRFNRRSVRWESRTDRIYSKGPVLAINFSPRPGMLLVGSKKLTIKPGAQSVVKPTLEKNGMCRMLVAYEDESGSPCRATTAMSKATPIPAICSSCSRTRP